MTTPFVDGLEIIEEEYLEAELRRLKTVEDERLRTQRSTNQLFDEENKKLISLIKERLDEHELVEKSISGFQNKLNQSQQIVQDLEMTLRKLQKDAEQSRR